MQISTMAVLAPAIGWLIPGAGHLMQKRWIRGLLLMASVVADAYHIAIGKKS